MKKHFIERALDIILAEVVLSVLGTLDYFVVLPESFVPVFAITLSVTVVYICWTVYCLCAFRIYIKGTKHYFFFNLPLYGFLFLSAFVTSCFDTEPYYTFLFLPFKLFYYLTKIASFPGAGHIDRPVSAMMFSAVLTVPLVLIPFIIDSRRKKEMTKDYDKNQE